MANTLMGWAGALAVLASFSLIAGGLYLWKRDRKRALLMLLAAAITLVNLYSWTTMPGPPKPQAGVTEAPPG